MLGEMPEIKEIPDCSLFQYFLNKLFLPQSLSHICEVICTRRIGTIPYGNYYSILTHYIPIVLFDVLSNTPKINPWRISIYELR